MRFADIPGLDEVKNSLKKSIDEEKVAHAQIFSGIEGGGNLAMARAYVGYLYCENRTAGDSCGECPACQKNDKLVHPDVHYVYPVLNSRDGKKVDPLSKVFAEDWRSFIPENPFPTLEEWSSFFGGENRQPIIYREESRAIISDLSLMSFEGSFKVMLIWLPELMHNAASNAILKILEEPPPRTLFLLVSNNSSQLLSTILSRCISITIRPFSDKEIESYLTEQGTSSEKAGQISHLADGSINFALRLRDNLEDDNHARFTEWMRACFEFNVEQMTALGDQFSRSSKISQRSLFDYGLNMLRETLVVEQASDVQLAVESEKVFVANFAKVVSLDLIEKMSRELESNIYYLSRNANAKILFLDLSLKFANLFRRNKI